MTSSWHHIILTLFVTAFAVDTNRQAGITDWSHSLKTRFSPISSCSRPVWWADGHCLGFRTETSGRASLQGTQMVRKEDGSVRWLPSTSTKLMERRCWCFNSIDTPMWYNVYFFGCIVWALVYRKLVYNTSINDYIPRYQWNFYWSLMP